MINVHPQNAVVTGGTDGIGKEIARGLARAGHRLVLVGRDAQKGVAAAQEILESTGSQGVRFIQANLSLVRETHRLAREVVSHFPALHYLVHSAGIVRGRRVLTVESLESNFATNYLSRFTLTQKLLPVLNAAGQPKQAARIVIISGAARNGKIHFDDVSLTNNFSTPRMVSQSCQANDVFTAELARRLALGGSRGRITVTCLKVGVVKTNIRREFPLWMKWLVPLAMDPLLAQTAKEAADPALRLLLSQEFEGITGALFLKIRKFRRIEPGTAEDPETGSRLWDLGLRLADFALNRP